MPCLISIIFSTTFPKNGFMLYFNYCLHHIRITLKIVLWPILPCTGVWLHALPIPSIGLSILALDFLFMLYWWLGFPTFVQCVASCVYIMYIYGEDKDIYMETTNLLIIMTSVLYCSSLARMQH